MAKSASDRRKYLRLGVNIKLRIITGDNTVVASAVKNLSPLGLGLESTTQVKEGEMLDLSLYLAEAKNHVHIQGKVAWFKAASKDSGAYDIGCEFIKIEEEKSFLFLVREIIVWAQS